MSLQYIKSQKGRNQLLYKGYLHKKERTSGDKIVWKCVDYHKYRCTGRAHTSDDQVVKYVPHLHPPHKTPVEAQKVVHGMKEMTSSQESAHERVTANCDVLPGAGANKKPRIQSNPKQTIQRLRACLNATRQGISDLQTPAAIAETVAADPPSSPSLTPPDLRECSDGSRDGSFMAAPILSNEAQASHSAWTWTSQEAGRQRFRTGPIPAGEAPQEMLSRLSEAAQQWLCPWAHNKDQIVDLVILEQFLNVLPVDMQAWLRAREPGSSKEAAQLAAAYSREQEPANMTQGLMTFEDISVHFTEEEWALLGHGEKNLYWNVMHQNYDNVACLGDGTDSKGKEKDTWWEPSTSSVVDLLGKSEEAVSQSPERDMIRENCLTRQTKNSSGKEEEKFVHFRKGLGDLARDPVHLDAELRMERWCICTDCEKRGESSVQKISTEEDSGPMILSEELHAISEKKNPQNPERSLIKEDQNHVEKQQSNHLGKEEGKSILLRAPVHQDTKLGQETQCISTDRTEQDESSKLVSDQNIYSGEDSEWMVLPGESWEMSEVGISQSTEQDLPPDPMCACSTLSPAELNGTADSISESHTLEKHQANSLENEGQEEEPILSGNSLRELTKDVLYPDTQSALKVQHMCINSRHQDESSKCTGSQKTDHRKDLYTWPKRARQFTQSSDPIIQPSCSYSGKNFDSLSAFIKCRRFGKKEQYFKERNIKSVLEAHQRTHLRGKHQKRLLWVDQRGYRQSGHRFLEAGKGLREPPRRNPLKLNTQAHNTFLPRIETISMSLGTECSSSDHKGLAPQQRCSSPTLLDKMVTESTAAQLIAVLQQVASDTAEIKSAVSNLHSTITAIHHALGSLSGCTDEAEHRISNLEDTSRNTKAQLVQHCNDIKAIEAKLVGKAVQNNVIAGLWSSLRVKRGASPLNLSPNS